MQNFTPNDLLLYVLNESNVAEKALIDCEIQTHSQTKEEVKELYEALEYINSISLAPNDGLIRSILEKTSSNKNIQKQKVIKH